VISKHTLARYLRGEGIEIGALNNPLAVDGRRARVRYVDMLDREGLLAKNPELSPAEREKVKAPDIVAEAEDLGVIPDASVDFVIASHILEHLPNPIRAIREFHRVLRAGGLLYLAIPDKRQSFDRERRVTPLSHVLDDYAAGATAATSTEHYQEWLDLVERKKDKPVAVGLDDIRGYRIHFHVWEADSLVEIMNHLGEHQGVAFRLLDYYYCRDDMDVVFVLRKAAHGDFAAQPLPLPERYPWLRRAIRRSLASLAGCGVRPPPRA
jgi:SAM-dependent methyltransferase